MVSFEPDIRMEDRDGLADPDDTSAKLTLPDGSMALMTDTSSSTSASDVSTFILTFLVIRSLTLSTGCRISELFLFETTVRDSVADDTVTDPSAAEGFRFSPLIEGL